MKLIVVSPQHKHEYTVEWIEAQTPAGFLIIKPDHAPIILSLIAGSEFGFLLADTHEKKIIHLMRPGFLEVTRQKVVALIGQDV